MGGGSVQWKDVDKSVKGRALRLVQRIEKDEVEIKAFYSRNRHLLSEVRQLLADLGVKV